MKTIQSSLIYHAHHVTHGMKYIMERKRMDNNLKQDIAALLFVLSTAFIIGMVGGSFDAMVITALILYIGIRYIQTQ